MKSHREKRKETKEKRMKQNKKENNPRALERAMFSLSKWVTKHSELDKNVVKTLKRLGAGVGKQALFKNGRMSKRTHRGSSVKIPARILESNAENLGRIHG